jgi:hypothetical protein
MIVQSRQSPTSGCVILLNFFAGMIVQGMVHKLSNRWFLMLLLVPAALLFSAILVCLCRACRMGKGYKSSSRMLVWTNQATLQPHLDMELSRELSST